MNIKKRVRASKDEDYGDTVVCCSVCGRVAIGERGEDFSQTICVDCGNNEWKVLPFTKGANVRQDPNDGEVAQAGIRKKRVGASPNFIKVDANNGDVKKAVFIDGERGGYHPDQVERNTITVQEMINALEEYPSNAKVFLRNDNGYTYGRITYGSIQGGTYDNKEVNVGEDIYYDDDDDEYEDEE